jgi:hypothetical protein
MMITVLFVAQQTGMHVRCGSTAYYLAILPGQRPDTYRHKETLLVEYLSRPK